MAGPVDKGSVVGGSIAALVGAMFMAIAFADSRDDAFPSGRMPVLIAGGAFFWAGAAVLVGGVRDELLKKGLNNLLGGLVIGSMVAVPISFALEKGSPPGVSWVGFACLGLVAAAILFFTLRSARDLARAGRAGAAAILAGAALTSVAGTGTAVWVLRVMEGGGWPSPMGPPVFDPTGAWEGDVWGEVVFERGEGNLFKGRYAGSKFFEAGTIDLTVYDQWHPSGHAWGRWQGASGRFGRISSWYNAEEGTLTGDWSTYSSEPFNGPGSGRIGWRRRAEGPAEPQGRQPE